MALMSFQTAPSSPPPNHCSKCRTEVPGKSLGRDLGQAPSMLSEPGKHRQLETQLEKYPGPSLHTAIRYHMSRSRHHTRFQIRQRRNQEKKARKNKKSLE